jgi:hypothetical protein
VRHVHRLGAGAKERSFYPALAELLNAPTRGIRPRGKTRKLPPQAGVLGNPPYNGFAGMAVTEECAHSTAYRTTTRVRRPEGQVRNDLLGRYFDLVRPASILKPAISGQNRAAPAPGRAVLVNARLRQLGS